MNVTSSQLLVLASRNQKKLGEIRELLAPFRIQVDNVASFSGVPETVEDGDSFAENAAKKAREVAQATGHWALGEDSGLCVQALGGAPGIYSARYAGEPADDAENNAKLQRELQDVAPEKRNAFYVCHAAVSDPEGEIQLSIEETCHGLIIEEARGENGFGYDPYFMIPEYRRTFGELKPIVKRQLSHRARTFRRLIPELVKKLG